MNIPTKSIADVLKEEHPSYTESKEEWKLFVDLYEGGKAARKHLFQYSREDEEKYKKRKSRAFYLNFIKQVLDTYGFFIFSKPPVRSEQAVSAGSPVQNKPAFTKFLSDVDRQGSSIDKFMKEQVLTRMALFGHSFVFVDTPNKKQFPTASPQVSGDPADREKAPVITEQQQEDLNLFAYFKVLSPLVVTNWAVDEDGKFLWIRWVEKNDPQLDPFASKDVKKQKFVYKTYTRTQWFRHEVIDNKLIQVTEGEHGSPGVVPVIKFQLQESLQVENCGLSAVADSVYINRAIFQWTSILDEDLFQKVMNVLVMSSTTGEKAEDVILSQHNVLEYSGSSAPFYLAPSASPGQTLLETISVGREFLFKLAHLGGTSNPTANQSGVSHAFDFNETNQFLKELGNSLSIGENELFKLKHRIDGHTDEWKGSVTYSEDYGIELPEDLVRKNTDAANFVQSPTFNLLMQQKVATSFIRKDADELKISVLEEINESISNAEVEKQKQQQAAEQPTPPQGAEPPPEGPQPAPSTQN